MKGLRKLFLFLLLVLLSVMASCNNQNPEPEDKPGEDIPPVEELTRLYNADGTYGGTLNESLYGYGTPLSGEADIDDSLYFLYNDYYHMTNTEDRIILPNFKTYQKTMADSDGLACILMSLAYDGKDVERAYSEQRLVKLYEEINGEAVYQKGTTSKGLKNLLINLNYEADVDTFKMIGSSREDKANCMKDWLKPLLLEGNYVLARLQYGLKCEWKVIIGIDEMKSSSFLDDVIIFANPNDVLDHYQDGYSQVPICQFWAWWMDAQPSGDRSQIYECVIIKNQTNHERNILEEARTPVQSVPELHMLLNADGTYGGTYDESKYGSGSSYCGFNDNLDSNYYAFVDYYNLTNEGGRMILPNYRAFSQTMASTCGICSTLSVFAYYGYNVNPADDKAYNEFNLMKRYENVTGKIIYNNGVGGSGLRSMCESFGITSEYKSYASANYQTRDNMIFSTYASFTDWVKTNLTNDTPMPISWKPVGGHWEVIIGYDDMGTETIYDDVIVLADSGDGADHYQDGYNTYNATLFYGRWFNGSHTYNQQYNIWSRPTGSISGF